MPKVKQPVSTKLKVLADEFRDDYLVFENRKLSCRCCGLDLGKDSDSEMKRWAVVQHINTPKHKKTKELQVKQQTLSFVRDTFSMDLCQAIVAADIPIYKLNNPVFRTFLEKYIGRPLPDQSTIRRNYLNDTYEATMTQIRQEIGQDSIWVSIDETTDACGRYIANVIIGKLNSKEPGRPILLNVAQLTKTNHQTIATLFNESMSLLWPSGVQYSKVLLFVTDAAPYMVKSATALKVFYPVMLHVTCLAHGLHRIAESVRSEYKAVDKLVASAKKIFLKAPDRVTAFHAQYPGLSLPPKPILTRWGTWLNCVKYYSEHLNQIEAFVQTLDPDDSSAIKEVQSLFEKKKSKIVLDIVAIQQFYSGIADTITMLEKQGMELTKAVELWEDSISYLSLSANPVIVNKTASISSKNPDLSQLIKLAKRDPSILQLHPFNEMTPGQLLNYNFAPLVSCDVERSFSMFKSVLRDNRRSFLLDNLKEHLVIGFYARV